MIIIIIIGNTIVIMTTGLFLSKKLNVCWAYYIIT